MEVAGLALGAISLAGMFSTCLDLVERADAYKSANTDSRSAAAWFTSNKRLLRKWGQDVGIDDGRLLPYHHEFLDDPEIVAHVKKVLASIKELCAMLDDTFNHSSRGQPDPKPPRRDTKGNLSGTEKSGIRGKIEKVISRTAALHRMPADLSADATRPGKDVISTIAKVDWALRGSTRVTPKLETLGELIHCLFELVPVPDSNIKDLLESLRKQSEEETKKSVKSWLEAPWRTDIYDRSCRRRLDNTCTWVLKRDFFRDWSSDSFPGNSSKVLWINGPAGHGKTILSAKITQHISSLPNQPLVAHYFVSTDSNSRNEAFTIIRSWLFQLVSKSQAALDVARGKWDQSASLCASDDEIVGILKLVLQNVERCTLVADGLDECSWPDTSSQADHRDRDSALGFFSTIAEVSGDTKTRILIFSRREGFIKTAFDYSLVPCQDVTTTEYQIQPDDVNQDVTTLSQDIVTRKLTNKSEQQRSDLAQRMVDKSQGMFLWMKMLEADISGGIKINKLRQIVEDAPTDIRNLYDRNWDRIMSGPEKSRALKILRWVAFYPITVQELTEALTIPDNDEDGKHELLEDEIPDAVDEIYCQSRIIDLCGSLVEIRAEENSGNSTLASSRVHLVHFSVKEYLLSRLSGDEDLRPAIMKQATSNEIMHINHLILLCFRYLGIPSVWTEELELEEETIPRKFIDFAVKAFSELAKREDTLPIPDKIVDAAMKLLDSGSPFWHSLQYRICNLQPEMPSSNLRRRAQLKSAEFREIFTDLPLGFAAWVGPGLLKRLISNIKIQINSANQYGWTALHCACVRPGGGEASIRLLINHGADVNARSISTEDTPLTLTTCTQKIKATALLLTHGSANLRTFQGFNLIHMAALLDNVELVTLLLDHGCNLEDVVTSNYFRGGFTPLHLAIAVEASQEMIAFLLSEGAPYLESTSDYNLGSSPLFLAVYLGRIEPLKLFFAQGADPCITGIGGTPLVHVAVESGQIAALTFLLDQGADMEQEDDDGNTALILAVLQDQEEALKILLDRGADTEHANQSGHTAVQLAAAFGSAGCLKHLLDSGADVTTAQEPNYGQMAAHQAAINGQIECIRLLGQRGQNAQDYAGNTPLHLAALRGHVYCLKHLLDGGADWSIQNLQGKVAAHYAAEGGHVECIQQLLVHQGRDIIAFCDILGDSPLHKAVQKGHHKAVGALLKLPGTNPSVEDGCGITPLMYATAAGDEHRCHILLANSAAGAALEQNDHGISAISVSVAHGHESLFKQLVATVQGQFDMPDTCGRSILWWTRRNGSHSLDEVVRREAAERGVALLVPATNPSDVAGELGEEDLRQSNPREGDAYCDVCLYRLTDRHQHYYACGVCSGGSACICEECFWLGACCWGAYHVLNRLETRLLTSDE